MYFVFCKTQIALSGDSSSAWGILSPRRPDTPSGGVPTPDCIIDKGPFKSFALVRQALLATKAKFLVPGQSQPIKLGKA